MEPKKGTDFAVAEEARSALLGDLEATLVAALSATNPHYRTDHVDAQLIAAEDLLKYSTNTDHKSRAKALLYDLATGKIGSPLITRMRAARLLRSHL